MRSLSRVLSKENLIGAAIFVVVFTLIVITILKLESKQ